MRKWPTGPMVHHVRGWPILAYASLLHLLWAALILADRRAVNTTTLHVFAGLWPWVTAVILVTVATLAIVATMVDSWVGVAAMLPQQVLLVFTAASAATAMFDSRFGDGVRRPRAFIIADQMPAVALVPLHAYAIFIFWSTAVLLHPKPGMGER